MTMIKSKSLVGYVICLIRLFVFEERNMILDMFNVKQVAKDKAWFVTMTGDFKGMVIIGEDYKYDPIKTVDGVDNESIRVTTESGAYHELYFKDYQLQDYPVIGVLREIRGYFDNVRTEPIIQAIYDMAGIIHREINTFGVELLRPDRLVHDFIDVCEIKDEELLIQAATYLLESQKDEIFQR